MRRRSSSSSSRCLAFSFSLGLTVFIAATAYAADDVQRLTLHDAEQRALDNHPQVQARQDTAAAAGQVVRETKSVLYPNVYANFTGVGAQAGTRIAAGGLNNPTILDRFAGGFSVSQLVTDFGRTNALVNGQSLRADAQRQDLVSVRDDVVLQVDRAYFDGLRAQAVLKVAQQTVAARQVVVDQVSALAASNLKSSLDVSFAKVSLAQAQLLLVQATNDLQAAFATLTAALGASALTTYELSEEAPPPQPDENRDAVIAQALRDRPDVAAARLEDQAAAKFAAAERALWYPTVSVAGAAGLAPYRENGLNSRYGAIGVNVAIPLSNGNLFAARRAEALFREKAEGQVLRDLENRVTREVTVAWLDARTARQRVDLSEQLLTQTSDALDLAQERYRLGLSSIVELTQAELQKTEAEIVQATARYDYQAKIATLNHAAGVRR
jgi:outer membrane protein